MNFNFNKTLERATERAKTKRPACRLGYGCRNYFWLKPGTTDVVCVGTSSWAYAELHNNQHMYPRHKRLFTYLPLIELHATHAIILPRTTAAEQELVPITKETMAESLKLQPSDIKAVCKFVDEHTYSGANTTLNNILRYLGFDLFHSGTGSPEKPGLYWFHVSNRNDHERVHSDGPVRYDYKTSAITAVDGELTKEVDEPARLELNKRVREATKRLKAISRLGGTFTAEDTSDILDRQNLTTATEVCKYFNQLTSAEYIMKCLEDLDLSKKDEVITVLMAIAGARTIRYNAWYRHYLVQETAPEVTIDMRHSRLRYACDITWANDPATFESARMAWLRKKLQTELGVLSYTKKQ